ncbi:cysteine hydrolase [Acidaminobacter sp. JC074]|uniref:isochorismatase family cysteine hydrolase n=1 Tax=Acidaminobacter sp. JC074 TaxID=2530199 RepID=UPI001F1100E0|nr:isochorismatase family cysteine hydrolase [Acidaminobacter sp. JC074]MCH4888469.1 cysteine hydrolase [Acidaminobacter sp. JC074]
MDKYKLYEESKLVIDSMMSPSEPLSSLEWDLSKTAVIVVDMINGFAKAGALYSDRVEGIIKNNLKVLETYPCDHIFLCDHHPDHAEEFKVFPAHCMHGTSEVEVVDELKKYSEKGQVIFKNSTNGFLEPEFRSWLEKSDKEEFIITGCCSDLCVMHFALSLKTHFNRINKKHQIVVVENAIDTYDISAIHHPGDFMHLMSLKMMKDNGILLRRIV